MGGIKLDMSGTKLDTSLKDLVTSYTELGMSCIKLGLRCIEAGQGFIGKGLRFRSAPASKTSTCREPFDLERHVSSFKHAIDHFLLHGANRSRVF